MYKRQVYRTAAEYCDRAIASATDSYLRTQYVQKKGMLKYKLRQHRIGTVSYTHLDPFEEENQEALVPFMRRVKERYPNKDVWAYTGYLYEELLENGRKHTEYTVELLSMIDVLVDCPFIEEQKDITLKFKGSANQRVIDMEKTRATGEVSILEFTKI